LHRPSQARIELIFSFFYTDKPCELFSDPRCFTLPHWKMTEDELNQRFALIMNDSDAQKEACEFSENEMRTGLKDRALTCLKKSCLCNLMLVAGGVSAIPDGSKFKS
jgi:hypothetical protein